MTRIVSGFPDPAVDRIQYERIRKQECRKAVNTVSDGLQSKNTSECCKMAAIKPCIRFPLGNRFTLIDDGLEETTFLALLVLNAKINASSDGSPTPSYSDAFGKSL